MPAKLIDLTGQRFGYTLVVERKGYKGHNTLWLCLCDCGTYHFVRSENLRNNGTRSCGCMKGKLIAQAKGMDPREVKLNEGFGRYKASAPRRGLEWAIDRKQFEEIATLPCFYCGAVPKVYHGLDRVDNNIGYTTENVVSCCKYCNTAKLDRSVDEFRQWVTKIYHNFGKAKWQQ